VNARVIAACVLLPLLTVAARMAWEAHAALAEADRLADRSELDAVNARVAALGKAARREVPFGPAGRARQALAALGRAGVPQAWEELRGALLATRGLVTPAPALLDEANRAIAAQRAASELGASADRAAPLDPSRLAERTAAHLARLERTGEPSRALALVAIAGLALLLGAAAARLGGDARARTLAAGAIGLVLFVVGLWRA
jgi:hypothetical protein